MELISTRMEFTCIASMITDSVIEVRMISLGLRPSLADIVTIPKSV